MLADYGKFHVARAGHTERRPRSVDEAVRCWREALESGGCLRVRGGGHGLGGATLPRVGETLVRTSALTHYRVETPGTITVGSGAVLWDVRDFVAGCGYQLPIYNGGWAGPTVGGFVCAGGMGLRVQPEDRLGSVDPASISERHGGFWANVAKVTLIDGRGLLREVAAGEADFPWIFASMGQFGLILEVELRLLPQPGAVGRITPASGRIPVANAVEPTETDSLPPAGSDWRYWFTTMLPVKEKEEAWQVIGKWCGEHAEWVRPVGGWVGPVQDGAPVGFHYLVTRKAPTPPLLYPRDEEFMLMGVMADCRGIGTDAGDAGLERAERAFTAAILERGWSLYPQAENLTRSLDFKSYWGDERWARFRELKNRFDPDDRINRGEMDPTAPPLRTTRLMRRVVAAARKLLDV